MRRQSGDRLTVFNGRDGEWLAEVTAARKKDVALTVLSLVHDQTTQVPRLLYFAPLKAEAQGFLIEKATELGVTRFCPLITARTVVRDPNLNRWQAQAKEAAEQCERLSMPDFAPVTRFDSAWGTWPAGLPLYVAVERGDHPPLRGLAIDPAAPAAILVGPEGGFTPEEIALILRKPFARPVSLGAQILRAETAALAALALLLPG